MRRLLSLLRGRRGETLVEVLMSMVLFLLIMAVLSGAMRFAASAQLRAEAIKTNAETVQQNLRSGTNVVKTSDGARAFRFKAISKDGSQEGTSVIFTVNVDLIEAAVAGAEGEDILFHLFE